MARLMLTKWPGRHFKDGYVTPQGLREVYAYLSLGDYDAGDETPMLALDLSYSRPGNANATVEAAMRAEHGPFTQAEEIHIGPDRYLVAHISDYDGGA
jgi:hypothetical protein